MMKQFTKFMKNKNKGHHKSYKKENQILFQITSGTDVVKQVMLKSGAKIQRKVKKTKIEIYKYEESLHSLGKE